MSRVANTFAELAGRRPALIGFLTAGFPDGPTSRRLARVLLSHCDLLELGLPFSDPVMDGPVLQETARVALEGGFRLEDSLRLMSGLREESSRTPLLFMTYYNPVLRRGLSRFAREAAEAGADGVLIADLPWDEGEEWAEEARECGLDNILFVSPTTSEERISSIASAASGFLYCISTLGTTGPREDLAGGLEGYLRRVRAHSSLPLALGIGITTPEQCRRAGELAEGVIVGSALMRPCLEALRTGGDPVAALDAAALSLRRSLEK